MIITKFIGRTGNNLFQNIGTSILSKKFDLSVSTYFYLDAFSQLGLQVFNGSRSFDRLVNVSDDGIWHGESSNQRCFSLMEILQKDSIDCGINFDGFFQVGDFIKNYQSDIKSHFNLSYQETNENDVFVHIRLGDVDYRTPGLKYYRHCLERISFDGGYISSDSLEHPIVRTLINEYNLQPFIGDPIKTINFAKDFNNLVLSQGTFSWWIGFLSRAKNIFWPEGGEKWHGDIFVFDDWKPIKFEEL